MLDNMIESTATQIQKAGAGVALLSFTIAVIAAHTHPATGYELSIYQATPLAFWIGIGISLLIAVGLSVAGTRAHYQVLGIGIVFLSVTTITALPLLRGYFFYGAGDALTHLGFVKDIMAGLYDFRVTLYPGMHILAAILSYIFGRDPAYGLLIIVPIFIALFLVCTTIAGRILYTGRSVPSAVALSSALLLPIITIRLPVLQPVPTTIAILFLSVPILLLIRYLHHHDKRMAVVFPISLFALLFYHPQHAAAFFLLLSGTSVGMLIIRLIRTRQETTISFSVLAQGSILGIVLFLWLKNRPGFQGSLSKVVFTIASGFKIGGAVAARGNALQQFGGGLFEIFMKVFFFKIVFCIFTVGIVILAIRRLLARNVTTKHVETVALSFGLIPVFGLVLLYILASTPNQYFRYIAFILVFVTIFGGVFVQNIADTFTRQSTLSLVKPLLSVFFILALVATIPTMFASPYVYQESDQVPKAQIVGYENTFEHRNGAISMGSTRSLVLRYRHAVYGREKSVEGIGISPQDELLPPQSIRRTNGSTTSISHHFENQSLSTKINQPVYLVITEYDKTIDTKLYEGARYSRADFRYLEKTASIDKVRANGQFTLYLIHPTNTASGHSIA